ncbi:ATP-dependent RecD-like DNA helicase [Sporosarcina sp. Marseille-Q4063]|uniref:SF1B family DNA helicase RecD2 n=1 Tax=Sporosarcina sp. Marseille-Q4063 TaxID=2810514 RepID=UPI001BB01CDA|nr:ATP-dependent RecD-like DNA helicase [Sporosarcina sp. Marseille-Q4063]QUW22166.1 ATP-dependent RecD-like DNA helicase [Sporosarcina sp. Marseille-Q4063]
MEGLTEELFILGRPLVTIFHNPDNLFTIAKLKISKTNCDYEEKEIIVKGNFPQLSADDDYKFTGRLVNHPTYGAQFDVHTFAKEMPGTETGLIHYLSGDLFPGIGMKTAESIVDTLGKDAIKKILDDSTVLDTIPRLSDERKETLISVLEQNMGLERTIIQLNEWGFGPKIAMRIYQTYREDAIELLRENPYRLTEEIEGVGFQRADELGRNLGITGDHTFRIKAAILHSMNEAVQSEGHVYIEGKILLPQVKHLLETSQRVEIPFSSISQSIIELIEEGKLIAENQRLYVPSLYYSEIGFASKLRLLLENELDNQFPVSEIRSAIGEVEERLGVNYAETQVSAIETALHSPTMILTGGPGTGKTTVIRGFVEVYAELHGLSLDPKEYAKKKEPFPIILAAPTGRAAKRMSESTGLPAMTIHRLLGFTGQEKEEETEREIEGSLVIIDEMSMVDTWLAHQLMKALSNDVQILFVGDQDQLPSVGPGQVLKDMLDSSEIPVIELTEIYRQSAGSTIIEMAHMIKRSEWNDNIIGKTSDRSFIKASGNRILEAVEKIVSNAISKGHEIRDIQILAPMYRGPAGIDGINKMIQQMVNPPGPKRKEVTFGDVVYRIGDKVLQLVNQPESNVFNGDMGEVIAIIKANETIDKKELLVVSYDGIEVTYERSDLNQITLSYCCSIHKSQGSEFPIVIMPVVRSHRKMLKRNLLYTGITRAQKFLILCGEPEEFKEGIARTDELSRQTTLKERLGAEDELHEGIETAVQTNSESQNDQSQSSVENTVDNAENKEPGIYKLTMDTFVTIDPMIGMNGISPYNLEGVD